MCTPSFPMLFPCIHQWKNCSFGFKSPLLLSQWQALAKKDKDSYVVASRLALYFWDSIPGKRLHSLLDRNQLAKKWQVDNEAKSMLKDPRSKAKFNDFMKQWLDMKSKELPSLSKKKFPNFSSALALDLKSFYLSLA